MRDCPTCKDSILNNQTSRIAEPKCADDCPIEVTCTGISTYTDCVASNVALPCIETLAGETVTNILIAMDEKLCETTVNVCTSKISGSDNCCGYLEDKLIGGDGIAVTTVTGVGDCETLVISEKCWEWNNFTSLMFSTGWRNFNNGYQVVQYSNVKQCTVELRGVATINSYRNEATDGIIGSLPAGFIPVIKRKFPVVVYSPSPNGYFPGFIEINTGGQILLRLTTTVSGYKELQVPLELRFEIN